jgi:hypothetical protein
MRIENLVKSTSYTSGGKKKKVLGLITKLALAIATAWKLHPWMGQYKEAEFSRKKQLARKAILKP